MIGPSEGMLACGEFGDGRMAEVSEIENTIKNFLNHKDLNLNALVTAGPTREYLDPVRYISNESSGLQGYFIAKKLMEAGVNTTLIIGPNQIKIDKNLNTINVVSADDMFEAVQESLPTNIAVCTAAVADFKSKTSEKKIKKQGKNLSVSLEENLDILNYISTHNELRPDLVVGFAAETNNIKQYALEKLRKKHCDWIVANDVSNKEIGFNSNKNEVTIFKQDEQFETVSKRDKSEVASILVKQILNEFKINEGKSLN